MFDYMDVITQRIVHLISLEELYTLSLGTHNANYPLLAPWADDQRFWADLCKARFDIRPFDATTAKLFLQAEYLFQKNYFQEAKERHSFRALHYFYEQHLNKREYAEALEVAGLITKYYGIVGIIISLTIYLAMVNAKPADAPDYARDALSLLDEIDVLIDDKSSRYYFTELKWEEQIVSNYESLDGFKGAVRDTFGEYVNLAVARP